jgi:hypothetical protein
MSDERTVRALRARLEHGEPTAAQAVAALAGWAVEAATRAARLDPCRLLGELAGQRCGARTIRAWSARRPTPPERS